MIKISNTVNTLLAQARNAVFTGITQVFKEFEKLELACEIDGVFWEEGYDEQDEPKQILCVVEDESSNLGLGVEIWYQGTNCGSVAIEKCDTKCLLEVLKQMEISLELAKVKL